MKMKSYRSVDEALSELEREYNVRARCFPDWIKSGKVNRIDAQDRLDRIGTALYALNIMPLDQQKELEVILNERGKYLVCPFPHPDQVPLESGTSMPSKLTQNQPTSPDGK